MAFLRENSLVALLQASKIAVDKKLLFSTSSSVRDSALEKETSQNSRPLADTVEQCRCNIAISKEVLEQAVTLPSRGGALGSLLSLLLTSRIIEQQMEMIKTISFLLNDKGNRKQLLELEASSVILQMMSDSPPSDPTNIPLLMLALRTLANLVAKEDSEKIDLWQDFRPEDHPLLLLVAGNHLSRPQLAEVLVLLRDVSFSGDSCSGLVLIQPHLLLSMEALLHPLTDNEVLLQALMIVRIASTNASCEDLALWTRLLFRLVPLLIGKVLNSTETNQALTFVDMSLTILINLAGQSSKRFREAIAGAGFVVPLLGLLQKNVQASIRTSASLILAAISESSSLARTQLSRTIPIKCILTALSFQAATTKDQDATVGLLVTLSQLASTNASALLILRQMGAIHTMELLSQDCDCDIAEEAENLVDLLSCSGKRIVRGSTYDWQGGSDMSVTITLPSNCAPS